MVITGIPQQGGFNYIPFNSPIVAERSSRKESRIALDLTINNVNENETIRQDEDQVRDLDVGDQIDWTDVICDERQLLDEECRELLKCTISCLMDRDKRGLTIQDRNKLVNKAEALWDRAMRIPADCAAALEAEKAAIISKMEERTTAARLQYARAAGSSLNSLAQQWAGFDEQAITAELMGVAAKYHWEGVRFQNDALNTAHGAADNVYHQFTNSMMARATNLLGILRGALDIDKREQTHDEQRVREEDETIARDVVTDRDLNRTTVDFQTHWHRLAIDSDAAGTYSGDVDDIATQSPVAP